MKIKNRQQLKILFDFFKNKKTLIISVLLIFLLNSIASIIAPLFLGKVIDVFRVQKTINLDLILKNGKGFIIIFSVIILIQIVSGIFQAYLKKESVIHYQNFIFDKVLMLPYLQLVKFRSAYLQSRWGSDSLNLSNFYSNNLFEMIKNFFIVVLGLIAAVCISPLFSLSILFIIIIMGISTGLITQYLIKQMKIYLEKFSTLAGKVNETIAGIIELKIMGFINSFRNTIKRNITEAANQHFSINLKALIVFTFINTFVMIGFFGILIYFGYLLTSNKMTIGIAVAYIAISFFIMKSLITLISGIGKLNTTFASLKRTTELLDLSQAGSELSPVDENIREIETVKDIELRNIWFKYEKMKDYVLKDFSYKFERGRVYALSGKSGVGKSTLIKILMGIIPAERGAVLINGNLLNKHSIPAFWEKIGYLSQDPFLFKGSLIENLVPTDGYGSEENRTKIQKALTDSGLDQIDILQPIEVEEGGKNFSGGEKRRISLSRALIKNSDVLILDEPVSQVDKPTAEVIINSIISFARSGKIALIIAHSDLALQKADEEINLTEFKQLSMVT